MPIRKHSHWDLKTSDKQGVNCSSVRKEAVASRCNCKRRARSTGQFSLQPPSVGRKTPAWSMLRKARRPRSSHSCPVPTHVPLRSSRQAAALGRKIIWLRLALAPHHQSGHEVFLRARRRLPSSIFCCSHSVTRRPPSLPHLWHRAPSPRPPPVRPVHSSDYCSVLPRRKHRSDKP